MNIKNDVETNMGEQKVSECTYKPTINHETRARSLVAWSFSSSCRNISKHD